jgi:hypothetical protein
MNMPFPTKAKMTALVCKGRIRPNVVNGIPKFKAGQNICMAMITPTNIPTILQREVAKAKFLTILLS